VVTQAAQRGLPAAIYRLPRILGDTKTGACQSRDLLWQIIKGCIQVQAVPACPTAAFQVAPADWTASTLVALSRTADSGAVYHVAGPARISLAEVAGYLQAAGYPVPERPLDQWTSAVKAQPGNAAIPALDVFLAELAGNGWSQIHLGTTATTRALGGDAPPCPDPTPALFATYLRYFTRTGYLPQP
jgi:thioester reductase-like protein